VADTARRSRRHSLKSDRTTSKSPEPAISIAPGTVAEVDASKLDAAARKLLAENEGLVCLFCIRKYSFSMRRITISLDEELARLAEAEVRAGRSPSVSAWVADAIRAKARARADLIADLEDLEQREPTSPEIIASMARVLGLPRSVVVKAMKSRGGPKRRAA